MTSRSPHNPTSTVPVNSPLREAESLVPSQAGATGSKKFKTRHLSMMALGSAIGAGFFLGSGQAASQAGPAVLVSYVIASIIVVTVMYALGELACFMPSTGSFSTYAEAGIGRWAGFTAGWLYWFVLIMVLGMEITGAAMVFVGWFPAVPQWVVALVIVVVFGGVNLLHAGGFGEVESWLAGVKVAAIIVFLLIGVALLTGIIPGQRHHVLTHLVGNGGFAPNGLAGIALALLAILTSLGGMELLTIAAAESEDPPRAIRKATHSVAVRILVFYIGSVFMMVCLLPWDSVEIRTNPFASVLNLAGIPAVGTIMEIIVFMALVSAFSANIYASSRMAYSLCARGLGPLWLIGSMKKTSSEPESPTQDSSGKADIRVDDPLHALTLETSRGDIARGRTPYRAVWVSVIFALVSVVLNKVLPDDLLGIILNACGMALIIVWAFIIVSQLRLHDQVRANGQPMLQMPGAPWSGWVILLCFAMMILLMLWTPGSRQTVVALGAITASIVATFFVRETLLRHKSMRRIR